MGRIKDLNSSVPGETDNLVFDGLNGTKRISYADFKQKLIDDGFGSGSSEAVVLTQAEYDALPDEVKDSDTIFFISDAPFENSNVVTLTKAQYDALSDATKMDGRFYYVTDEEEVAKSLVVQENVNSTETVPSSAVLYAESADIRESLSPFVPYGLTPRDGRYVGNLNDINVGVYYVDPGAATNCPVTARGWCVSFNDSQTDSVTYVKTQFYFTTNTFVLYMRHRNTDGTWTAWKSITFT